MESTWKEIHMNTKEPNVLKVEREFFNALMDGNSADLDQLLSDDFLLIDVLSGAEINKSTLLAAVEFRSAYV